MMQSEHSDSLNTCKHESNDSTECCICLNSDDFERYTLSQCQHTFHSICLREWLDNGKSTCPYCRGKVLKKDKISIGCGAWILEFLRKNKWPYVTLEDLFTDTESDTECDSDFHLDTDSENF
ncbi:hypothetical protein TNCV_1994771 [Trichonephila clavipes]|uniref:RING-type domain-containing protein n=1 Tax=Trichonephila clavipes TaxID=2585209 RepID=A0A8X6R1X2_TRICX|nr:hypothetical protein TNCV_1994771 [Trichonephila clavipes]